MTSSGPSRRALLAATSAFIAAAAAVTLISACSAGQITQTGAQVPAIAGVNINAGPNGEIALRDILIPYGGPQGYPRGADAPLAVRIFNDGPRPIKLVRVSAGDAARAVLLVGRAAAAQPAPSAPASPFLGSASPSASPEQSPTAAPAGQETFSIEIGPDDFELLVPGTGEYLQLTGLTRPIPPGTSVPLTFTFDDGTTVNVNVPLGVPMAPVPRVSGEPHTE